MSSCWPLRHAAAASCAAHSRLAAAAGCAAILVLSARAGGALCTSSSHMNLHPSSKFQSWNFAPSVPLQQSGEVSLQQIMAIWVPKAQHMSACKGPPEDFQEAHMSQALMQRGSSM